MNPGPKLPEGNRTASVMGPSNDKDDTDGRQLTDGNTSHGIQSSRKEHPAVEDDLPRRSPNVSCIPSHGGVGEELLDTHGE